MTSNEDSIFNYLQAGVDAYADGTIVNADVHSSANIQSDKLNLTAVAQGFAITSAGSFTNAGTTTLNGTTNTIGNGGSDTLTLNVPGGMTLSAATTWTLTGALTFSGTITDLGTVTTANIDGGTLDGVQIGGTTATGELIVNDASDDADGLGSQGTSGQFLISQGTGVNPTFSSKIPKLSRTTFTTAASSGDITITAGNKYIAFLRITAASVDNEILFLRFDDDSGASQYNWVIDELLNSTSPTSTLTGDDADSEIQFGTIENTSVVTRMACNFIFDANDVDNGTTRIVSIFGHCSGNSASGLVTLESSGFYRSDGTVSIIEFHVGSGTMTGDVTLYEFNE